MQGEEAGGAVASGSILAIGDTGEDSYISGYIKATGGTGGWINSVPGSHHSGVHANSKCSGGIGGSPNGRNGSWQGDANERDTGYIQPPGKGWALSVTKQDGTYGQGGLARHTRNIRSVWVCRATGGSGGYDSKTISVTPGQILTIKVGAGGEGESRGLDSYRHICWAEPGNNGFALIQYKSIRQDYELTTTRAVDENATDKEAPEILELYLSGVRGKKDYYEVKINAEDHGTKYIHFVKGVNKSISSEIVTSNDVETEVISLIDGYSWKIDTNATSEPDNIIGDDFTQNEKKTFITQIDTNRVEEKKYYLHVKAIDKVGNIGKTVHLKLEPTIIKLTGKYGEQSDNNGYGPNYVPLSWTNSDKKSGFYYNIFQREDSEEAWEQVITKYRALTVNATTADDMEAPEISSVQISENKKEGKIELNISGIDHGTGYEHYIEAHNESKNGKFYSNTVHTIVKTGIKKFEYIIQSTEKEPEKFTNTINATNKEKCTIIVSREKLGQYLHIRAIDMADNVGETVKIHLDGSRTISKEEKDGTKELYCVDKNVEIPAIDDGTSRDATINVGEMREVVTWLLEQPIQRLFEIFKADKSALNYPYYETYSNTLGKYKVTGIKNADDARAYILSHYNDNTIENSVSQNALYEILAEEGLMTGDTRKQ